MGKRRSPLACTVLLLVCLPLFGNTDVFLNKDTLVVLSEGSATLGTGLFPDSLNPFAVFTAKNSASKKADTFLCTQGSPLVPAPKLSDPICEALFGFSTEILKTERLQPSGTVVVSVQIMAKAPLAGIRNRLDRLRRDSSAIAAISSLELRANSLASACCAWPNTRENCTIMAGAIAALDTTLAGITARDAQTQLREFDHAIALDGSYAYLFFLRGRAQNSLQKPLEAIADFSKALVFDSALVPAYSGRGRLLQAMGKDSAALEDFGHAALLDTTDKQALVAIGVLLAKKESYEDALLAFSRVIALDSACPAVFLLRAAVYDSLKQYTRAIGDYTAALAHPPASVNAYICRGIDYIRLGKGYETDADRDFTRALTVDSQNTSALYWRGCAYINLARYASAAADFSRAIGYKLASAEVFFNRGYALLMQKKYGEAIQDLSAAIGTRPQWFEPCYYRVYCYGSLGKWQESAIDMNGALAINPQSGDALFNLAYACKMLKRNEEAIMNLSRYLDLKGNSEGKETRVKQMIQEIKYDFDEGKPSPEQVIREREEKRKKKTQE
jgi:tetratricopeptide (TPR) repeat protein